MASPSMAVLSNICAMKSSMPAPGIKDPTSHNRKPLTRSTILAIPLVAQSTFPITTTLTGKRLSFSSRKSGGVKRIHPRFCRTSLQMLSATEIPPRCVCMNLQIAQTLPMPRLCRQQTLWDRRFSLSFPMPIRPTASSAMELPSRLFPKRFQHRPPGVKSWSASTTTLRTITV